MDRTRACSAELRPWLHRADPILCEEPAGHVDPYDPIALHRRNGLSWHGLLSWMPPVDGSAMTRQPAEWVLDERCQAPCCRTDQ